MMKNVTKKTLLSFKRTNFHLHVQYTNIHINNTVPQLKHNTLTALKLHIECNTDII